MAQTTSYTASNMNAFLAGASVAINAPVQFGGIVPTPMVAVKYVGYRVSRPPTAVDANDLTDENERLRVLRSAFYHLLVAVLATTADLTQTTQIFPTTWEAWDCLLISLGHLTLANPVIDQDITRGIIELPATQANALYAAVQAARAGNPPDLDAYMREIRLVRADLRLPDIGAMPIDVQTGTSTVQTAALTCGAPQEMASLYALAIYLMGRPYSTSATAISVRRTANLEAKGNRGVAWPSISGNAKMSIGAIKMISLTWERDPKMRSGCFTPLIGLNLGTADPNITMITTMTGLLPMSQMSHVKILLDFFHMYPFARFMDSLSGEMFELADSVAIWNTYPAQIRPFCGVLYRDQFKAFQTRKLERVIRLANDVLARTAPTVAGYAIRGADQALLNEFDQLRHVHMPPVAPVAPAAAQQQAGPPTI